MSVREFLFGRREFLKRFGYGAFLALLTRCGLLGGGSSSDRNSSTSTESGHFHVATLKSSALSSPPATGTTVTTLEANGHTHEIEITQSQLQQIKSFARITLTTSLEDGHEHTIIF